MKPYIDDPHFKLYLGDAREALRYLMPKSIDCVVTSPPYYALRDYGTGAWEGGDRDCSHEAAKRKTRYDYSLATSPIQNGMRTGTDAQAGMWHPVCPSCGATRVDNQIGLEQTVDEYVNALVHVFSQVKRALALHGTVWLNLGDTTIKKQLQGIPWRVAFALQADGWYLRSDVIWSKPNPMPESITDRPTKAHEYVFLLTRKAEYFFDQEAVFEAYAYDGREKTVHDHKTDRAHPNYGSMIGKERWPKEGRNVRSVWTMATESSDEAHFATFPTKLVQRCVQAGCPEKVCRKCSKTDCHHDHWRKGVVLDPFMGTGTTARVAIDLGRQAVGCELNEEYAQMCARRLGQQSLLSLVED